MSHHVRSSSSWVDLTVPAGPSARVARQIGPEKNCQERDEAPTPGTTTQAKTRSTTTTSQGQPTAELRPTVEQVREGQPPRDTCRVRKTRLQRRRRALGLAQVASPSECKGICSRRWFWRDRHRCVHGYFNPRGCLHSGNGRASPAGLHDCWSAGLHGGWCRHRD